MEFFFLRLEKYKDVRPSAAMTDIIVKIMVEVLSILGIVTKEIGRGKLSAYLHVDISPRVDLRAEKFFTKLVGMKALEDSLQRLDKLTQEEARMAAAEALKVMRSVESKVEGVDHKVEGVGHKVGSVIEGELYTHWAIRPPPNLSSTFYSIRCQRGWSSDSTGDQKTQRPRTFVISQPQRRPQKLDLSYRE